MKQNMTSLLVCHCSSRLSLFFQFLHKKAAIWFNNNYCVSPVHNGFTARFNISRALLKKYANTLWDVKILRLALPLSHSSHHTFTHCSPIQINKKTRFEGHLSYDVDTWMSNGGRGSCHHIWTSAQDESDCEHEQWTKTKWLAMASRGSNIRT